jgi:hypothetical protein
MPGKWQKNTSLCGVISSHQTSLFLTAKQQKETNELKIYT